MIQSLTLNTDAPEDTQAVGRALGNHACPGDVILLTGPLGAGKTCLTQGIAHGLGVDGYVRSPTFVLMTRHHGRLTLHHVDHYRIASADEDWDLGLEELLSGDGLCVAEGLDRALELFPDCSLWVALAYGEGQDQRSLNFSGGTDHHRAVLELSLIHI